MGTHSLTYVVNSNNQVLCAIYGQFDGYPGDMGRGRDLYNFLAGRKLCNGIGAEVWQNTSNGLDDLAALLVWYLKDGSRIGNIYLCPPPQLTAHEKRHAIDGEDFRILLAHCSYYNGEYAYVITATERAELRIIVFEGTEQLYDGSPDGLAERFGCTYPSPLSATMRV